MKVLITGGNGYLGTRLVRKMSQFEEYELIVTVRDIANVKECMQASNIKYVEIGDLSEFSSWKNLLAGVDCVVHMAAVINSDAKSKDEWKTFYNTNVLATESLVSSVVSANVGKFIFLSSVAVYGDFVNAERVCENNECSPKTNYGKSKYEAEEIVKTVCIKNDINYLILRPPMVYGKHCRGNIVKLVSLLKKPVPIPIVDTIGKRNLIGVDNLVDALLNIINNKSNKSGIWNIAELDVLNLADILRYLSIGLGRNVTFIRIPSVFIRLLLSLVGKKHVYSKLDIPVIIDSQKFRNDFKWSEIKTTKTGIIETGDSFR